MLSAVSMSLCMIAPISLENGFIFDLRFIPFVIIALYGGFRSAFLLYVVLNVMRFIIGANGVWQSFFFSTALLVIVPLFHSWFINRDPKTRIISASISSLSTAASYLIIIGVFTDPLDQQFWVLTGYALSTYVGLTAVLMILIEKIKQNVHYRHRFIQSERFNVVGELAASFSHEIRNPLTVASGFLQLLNKSNTLTEKEKGYVELSLEELGRIEQIVSDYLTLAKPQSENMVYSNLSTEFEYTQNMMMPFASLHNVEVKVSFHNSLKANYDRNQMNQCLIYLYRNGIESMSKKGGGTLTIEIGEHKNNILVSIKDTGEGMTKEELSRLGKPYYSIKEEGIDLGMLMVYSTINKLKGNIEVISEKGEGTTVLLTIPAI